MENSFKNLRPGTFRFTVNDELSGLRLDQYLAQCSDHFSRTTAKRLISVGGVHLAGRRMRRESQPVKSGEHVEVFVDPYLLDVISLNADMILYRDQDLIVINKPAGMATNPIPSRYKGTVYSELQNLLQETKGRYDRPSIGMVQRLDRETSGVMVFSIHKRSHKKMTDAFRGRDIDKTYWALVAGIPQEEQGEFHSQLARRRATNLMVSVERGGKSAETHYRLLKRMERASLVEVKLLTGRSHQIRVHFSEAGLPLLGDTAYGGPKSIQGLNVPRQMLHSRELAFAHPVTGKMMVFTAPLPDDFSSLLTGLEAPLNGSNV